MKSPIEKLFPGAFRIHRTKFYLRLKLKNFNIYFSTRPMRCRSASERALHNRRWQELKKELFKRYGCCQECGVILTKRTASVHHIVARSVDRSKQYDINNLLLLCPECHMRIHQMEHLQKKYGILHHQN